MTEDQSPRGAVLSDRTISLERTQGNIVIEPFRKEQLSPCSYDVTLGEHFYRPTREGLRFFNPWNAKHAHLYWSSGVSQKASVVTNLEEASELGLPLNTQYILIPAGESILAHTQEFIGGKHYITTMMKARSSMGRSNTTVCRDAGWGDTGFTNRWTMIITNYSGVPLVLPVGARVAQIIFFYTDKPDVAYQGKYQGDPTNTLQEMTHKWSPAAMLPKLSLEVKKVEIPAVEESLMIPLIPIVDHPDAEEPEKIPLGTRISLSQLNEPDKILEAR